MNRRDFLRRSALITAGTVAADQIELLEKLTWKRTMFPAGGYTPGGIWLVSHRDRYNGQLVFSDKPLEVDWQEAKMLHAKFTAAYPAIGSVLTEVERLEPKRLVTGRNAATGELHRL